MQDIDEILKPEEVADILRIGLNECYKSLNNHSLEGYKVGRSWRIPKSSINKYIQDNLKREHLQQKKRNG